MFHKAFRIRDTHRFTLHLALGVKKRRDIHIFLGAERTRLIQPNSRKFSYVVRTLPKMSRRLPNIADDPRKCLRNVLSDVAVRSLKSRRDLVCLQSKYSAHSAYCFGMTFINRGRIALLESRFHFQIECCNVPTVALFQIRNARWFIIDIWRMFTCKKQTVGGLTCLA